MNTNILNIGQGLYSTQIYLIISEQFFFIDFSYKLVSEL